MDEPSMLRSTGDRMVIVGGGIGGALLAKTLQNHADVVLIDPYYVNAIAVCFCLPRLEW
jgi:aspartate oxidase